MEKGFYDPNQVPQYNGEPKKKTNMILIVVISAAVLILGLIAFVISFFLVKSSSNSSEKIKPETRIETTAPKMGEKKQQTAKFSMDVCGKFVFRIV